MESLLERFCRYVRIDTQADESATTYPSATGQLHLGRVLVDELQALGVRDASHDAHGLVWATIPATVKHTAPVIAWIRHVDTSPETSGHNVKPIVHRNYDGGDIEGTAEEIVRCMESISVEDVFRAVTHAFAE